MVNVTQFDGKAWLLQGTLPLFRFHLHSCCDVQTVSNLVLHSNVEQWFNEIFVVLNKCFSTQVDINMKWFRSMGTTVERNQIHNHPNIFHITIIILNSKDCHKWMAHCKLQCQSFWYRSKKDCIGRIGQKKYRYRMSNRIGRD